MLPPQTSRTRTTAPFGRLFGRPSAQHIAALALALVSVTACSDDDPAPSAPARADIVLSDTSITLIRGTATPNPTKQVTASITGGSGAVTWSTPRPDIATISPAGLVTAVADGSTYFTATSDADPSVNRTVVVNVVSTIVTITPAANFSWVGGPSRTLGKTVQNNANTAVTWRTSNAAVATVSAAGVVTPVAAGTANITAQSVGDPAKEAVATFTVDQAPLAAATPITSGTAVANLSAAVNEFRYWRIEVPVGATSLKAETTGATSDIDLFILANALPTQTYTNSQPTRCFSAGASGNESCTITNPQSRVYYVMIDAFEAYSGVTLKVTVTP